MPILILIKLRRPSNISKGITIPPLSLPSNEFSSALFSNSFLSRSGSAAAFLTTSFFIALSFALAAYLYGVI